MKKELESANLRNIEKIIHQASLIWSREAPDNNSDEMERMLAMLKFKPAKVLNLALEFLKENYKFSKFPAANYWQQAVSSAQETASIELYNDNPLLETIKIGGREVYKFEKEVFEMV